MGLVRIWVSPLKLKKPMRKHRFFCAFSVDEARFNLLIASKKAAALKAAKLFQSFKPHLDHERPRRE
jgi:hypothetical protein